MTCIVWAGTFVNIENTNMLITMTAAIFLNVLFVSPPEDSTIADLLHREDVQAEIKLTDKQRKKLNEVDPLPKFVNTGTFESDKIVIVDPELALKKEDERERKVWLLLSPDQVTRIFQLHVQRNGVRTITRSDVQAHLQFTDSQKDSIRLAVAGRQMDLRDLIKLQKTKGLERDRVDPKKLEQKVNLVEQKYTDALRDILTLDQVNALEALGGKKFVFATRSFRS